MRAISASLVSGSGAALADVAARVPPGEDEVAEGRADHHCDAEVHVVRHEDEHEEVADHQLDRLQGRLHEVYRRENRLPVTYIYA